MGGEPTGRPGDAPSAQRVARGPRVLVLYAAMAKKRIYRVTFRNDAEVYEVYCQKVGQSDIFGFIEIEGFLFGERSKVVVDPSEEKLKIELAGVERSLVPLHAVIRIDAVDRSGSSKVHSVSASAKSTKVTTLPTTIYTPRKPKA
jgi:hypothetical protein